MLARSPVIQSALARTLFLASAAVTVLILIGITRLRATWELRGLTPIFFMLFAVLDYRGAICSLLILLCAAVLPGLPAARGLLRSIGEHPGVVAAASAALMCVCALLVYRNHPLSMDEYTVLFQSKVFAAGHLNGQLPAPLLDRLIAPAFRTLFFNASPTTGKIVSAYWPSFALLLAPFTLVGIPWACNPVLSAGAVLAIHRLTMRLFADTEAAGLAVLLTVASPVFFADGISYYSMQAHLLANALYALLLVQPTARRAFWAGVVGSIALTLHNPVPHMLFAAPWLIWMAARRERLPLLGWLIAGYLPLCLVLGFGWFLFAGHIMHEGIRAAAQPAGGPSLLQRVAWPFALPSSRLLLARLIGIAKVSLWAVPGLAILAVLGFSRRRDDVRCRLLALSALTTLFGYLFVWSDQGHGWGFRFFHSAWLVLPVLAAGALAVRPAIDAAAAGDGEQARAYLVSCALCTLLIGVSLRAVQIRTFISDDLSQLPHYAGSERRVVLVDASHAFYGADLVQNDPWLRGSVVSMLSYGPPADAAMIQRFFPEFHQVFADVHGTVWSAAPSHTPKLVSSR